MRLPSGDPSDHFSGNEEMDADQYTLDQRVGPVATDDSRDDRIRGVSGDASSFARRVDAQGVAETQNQGPQILQQRDALRRLARAVHATSQPWDPRRSAPRPAPARRAQALRQDGGATQDSLQRLKARFSTPDGGSTESEASPPVKSPSRESKRRVRTHPAPRPKPPSPRLTAFATALQQFGIGLRFELPSRALLRHGRMRLGVVVEESAGMSIDIKAWPYVRLRTPIRLSEFDGDLLQLARAIRVAAGAYVVPSLTLAPDETTCTRCKALLKISSRHANWRYCSNFPLCPNYGYVRRQPTQSAPSVRAFEQGSHVPIPTSKPIISTGLHFIHEGDDGAFHSLPVRPKIDSAGSATCPLCGVVALVEFGNDA